MTPLFSVQEIIERRLPEAEVNAAVVATYLAGGNQRRIRAAVRPLLKTAPLSKSAVSRIVVTLTARDPDLSRRDVEHGYVSP